MPNTFQSVAIPQPDGTVEGHQACLMALKEAVEVLLHQRDGAAAGGGGVNMKSAHSLNPVIVSESATQLRTLTVGEAVMQLDLTETPAVVFRNSAHGEINVVYRRADGHIGWIDAHAEKARA